MANIVTTTKDTLRKIFDRVNRVYLFEDNKDNQGNVKHLSQLTNGIELPVLDGGVTFNTGDPETNEIKLTDQTVWVSTVNQGDSDISFQVSSVHDTINDLLMEKKTDAEITEAVQIGDYDYTGQGYALSPKKIACALVMTNTEGGEAVYLPNVECFASFNGEGGDDSTAYYNVAVTPLTDAKGAGFYILNGKKHQG